jgi:two-component system sensor histidine kinase QseC
MQGPRSLQGRLLGLVLGLVVGVWIVTALWTWIDVQHELDELLDGHLAQAAALLVARQAGEIEDTDDEIDAPSLHRYAPKVAFQVFHEGHLALRSSNAPTEPMLPVSGSGDEGFRNAEMGGVPWRVFVTRGRELDTLVFVGEQVDARQVILWAVLRGAVLPMLLALPLLALAVWWAVRRGILPMRVLGRTLSQRQPWALQPVALEGAPAEMTPMLDALNSLFQRIGDLMASERRFTADAAHELRTPIAAVRAQAQVAMASTEDAERHRALEATLLGCDRATRLVEQLMTLSRLESGAAPALAAVDVGVVVRQVAAEAATLALDKHQNLSVEAAPSLSVHADATLLSVLVRNLVDNAIRYSPPCACVKVAIQGTPGGVELTVEDSGPGLSPKDAERLGERFFRVLGTGQSGSGLGWSITKRIATVLAAAVKVSRSAELGGLRVSLTFPRPAVGEAR